ncbi:hypothetical protein Ssi02_75340 [Sinosporangium siamense]|uniref:Maleylpyruvate isomerase family mycothiol-dependent enzyme n=2 Tax=Sinosporangium siamense TaxID=1367973 RepID=A0A919RP65_9ACTN|nr:hypothetical protein Ssi02_75340 [Sinosporangium siamense]
MNDLVMHLGGVHRQLIHLIGNRLPEPHDMTDITLLGLPEVSAGWPRPEDAPNTGPTPAGLLDWFAKGAALLGYLFTEAGPGDRVWTWSDDHTVGFWLRMQTIEAAVHRYDAELATGRPSPIHPDLAVDAVAQTFDIMVPARRAWRQAPPGGGERFRFRRDDGPEEWTVVFDGDQVRTGERFDTYDGDVTGTASELMLFLWQRVPAERLRVSGDLGRYFSLAPPV